METALIFASTLVPIVWALTQVAKSTVKLPKTIVPFLALVLGLFVGFVAYPFTDLAYDLRLWAGALAGLASVGFFEIGNKRPGTTQGLNK